MFYDNREAYRKKWMAIVYVKQRKGRKKVCKLLGRFNTMIQAAEASAKPGPTATDWDQLKSTLHSVIDDWVDRQKADAYPAR